MSCGWVSEIFRSIQGEGLFAGILQVFIRFSGCSRGCLYCDTPGSRERSSGCRADLPEGEVVLENPVSADAVSALALSLAAAARGVHSLSITGGEPLEQPGFLEAVLGRTGGRGIPLYLETNGLETGPARSAAPLVDIVSLDIKLPSLCGGGDTFGPAAEALEIFSRSELFCKVVAAGGTEAGEVRQAAKLIAARDRGIPLVIQPASESGGCVPPSPGELLEYHEEASRELEDVRVIPQMHRILGLR